MAGTGDRAARVWVDYSQYWVRAGPDVGGGADIVPGLLRELGPQAVAVITGLHDGRVTVTARALQAPPAGPDPDWDVAAETDLECPGGVISVCDWGGPCHGELGVLAAGGPGRYRLRVHARNRRPVGQRQSAEEHYLLFWPVSGPAPARLLTGMDEYGRVFNGEPPSGAPGLDGLDRAAGAGVIRLADLVAQPAPPQLSGELTVVRAEAIAPATPRRVWGQVVVPWGWLGSGGGGGPAGFEVYLLNEPWLEARGRFVTEEPYTDLAFTWSWSTTRMIETSEQVPVMMERDLVTGEVRAVGSTTARSWETALSWALPADPTTVSIHLARHGKGTTAVELCHRDLPAELAGAVQPFWDWALRELRNRLSKVPFYGLPWDRLAREGGVAGSAS
jgi:hypothetical protein